MKPLPHLAASLYALRLGFTQVLQAPLANGAQFMVLMLLVITYGAVFQASSPASLKQLGIGPDQLTWYIALTEYIIFSVGPIARQFQAEIRQETYLVELLRPCPMWVIRLSEWSGETMARALVLLLPLLLVTGFVAGSYAPLPLFVLAFLTAIPIAAFLHLGLHFIAGAAALWWKNAEPAWWFCQKMLFVFGALLWPLALYPDAFQTLCWVLPFAAFLAAPGNWVFTPSLFQIFLSLLYQIFWLGVMIWGLRHLDRAFLRRVQREGS